MARLLLFICALVPIFALLASARATEGPKPPCAGEAHPEFPTVDARPKIRVWFGGDIEGGWVPAECTGWDKREFTVLVALAGRFHHDSGVEGVLRRIAAISDLKSMQYWSATRKRWRQLVPEAYALKGPDKALRRPDFSLEEVRSGEDLYYWQKERSVAGNIVYRIRLRESGPERIILEMENAVLVKRFLFTLYEPGQQQLIHFMENEGDGNWRYYSLLRVKSNIGATVRGHEASFINRAVAIYRYFAGVPTDREPPAAP